MLRYSTEHGKSTPFEFTMESPLVHRLGRWLFALDLQNAHGDVLHTIVSIFATSFLHTDDATGYREKDTTSHVGPNPTAHVLLSFSPSASRRDASFGSYPPIGGDPECKDVRTAIQDERRTNVGNQGLRTLCA